MTTRILICNRMLLYAEGLRRLLAEDERFAVVAAGGDAETVKALAAFDPHVVIADPACFEHVAGTGRTILLTWDGVSAASPQSFGNLRELVNCGLAGVLDARTDPVLLRKAVTKVCAGELWLDQQIIRRVLRPDAAQSHIQLSRREIEIVQLLRQGFSNKRIASELCISEQTVKTHCNHLFKKFSVSSRLQLVLRTSPDSLSSSPLPH